MQTSGCPGGAALEIRSTDMDDSHLEAILRRKVSSGAIIQSTLPSILAPRRLTRDELPGCPIIRILRFAANPAR
jgi:hypothetical protein